LRVVVGMTAFPAQAFNDRLKRRNINAIRRKCPPVIRKEVVLWYQADGYKD
jgi:hypothetical protein